MHGHQFLVTGMGQQDETLQSKKLSREAVTQAVNGNDKKMLTSKAINKNPSFRDTVTVPSKGYIKIKFNADNPGEYI
jgi:FtsP/CotA-like multicopper oxidase with cupredoxin domain